MKSDVNRADRPFRVEVECDEGVADVRAEIYRMDPNGERIATVLRDTLDQLYDGRRTGRWELSQLFKAEKESVGPLVEINLQREFRFEDGIRTDYKIAGVEVDCKYSVSFGDWQLLPEAVNRVALVVHADEKSAKWCAGLIPVKPEYVNNGIGMINALTLSGCGVRRIEWLWGGFQKLAPNLFIELDQVIRERILGARATRGEKHGQARVNELFRQVHGRIIRRAELATVAQQDDFMKRARDNGGARTHLRPEGILILGHQRKEVEIAQALGLPIPRLGEFVAARVVPERPGRSDHVAAIAGSRWIVAGPDDPYGVAAPVVPR
ncbi:NaeI family type II restriction endonuclease [Nocardia macrotermitis]|uniref:Type-2 restriction enzyme NaeI n=1 Tax=Nocardia macrotermitis TaxID=2585198 RepID=A0A7K0D0D8_9NOCA|nr:NaeI family type II restriction endonuclease [Nocardia macrotermitis]MQY18404.1 Type-2 restriction enzyme NaeI [Nocardia macrotermitis]